MTDKTPKVFTSKDCEHTYGYFYTSGIISSDINITFEDFIRFTYCPWCKTKLQDLKKEGK